MNEPATAQGAVQVTVCTIATLRQLPAVRVLVKSFADHNPDARWHVLLVDCDSVADLGSLDRFARDAGFVHPTDLGIDAPELNRLRTAYTPDELCAVLRPRLMRRLVTSTATSGPVLHLDPSVLVLGPIVEPVLAGLVTHSLVLLPRVSRPLPEDGLRPDAADLRSAGMFDPALVAVNRGADDFLRAWAEHALREPDSAFLDGAAVLLDHHVLRDAGIGLSVWNVAQRPLHADEYGAVTVSDVPLRSLHFTGFDPARPWLLAAGITDHPRVLLSEHRLLARLCAAYVAALSAAAEPGDPPGITQRVGSSALPPGLRREYRAAWLAADRDGAEPPPPITATADFLAWACAPADGSTRWASAVWRDDPDLRRRFPDPSDAAFREWCASAGVSSGALPPEAVPHPPDGDTRLTDQLGISVLGTGRVARLLRAAATASGLPVSTDPDYPVVLCCDGVPAGLPQRRYVIALAEDHAGAHEIWALSAATRSELDGAVVVPVHTVPLPVPDAEPLDPVTRAAARDELGWPDKPDAVVFVAVVDHAHERADNALGAVAAFALAFPDDRPDVRLLLLVDGAAEHQAAAERLRMATADDDRIELVEQGSATERPTWLDTADCLLAPHLIERGCGDRIGLVIADAAARALPVITAGAGSGDLLTSSTALLVPTGPDGRAPDPAGLVDALHAVANDLGWSAELGRAGRNEIRRGHAISVAGARLRDRVEHAYHTWRARNAAARLPQDADPLRPLRSARHVLLREPDVGVSHKIPMAPALRKAVLRVLNHYDAHIRTVLGTLVDGMERSIEELAARQEANDAGADLTELTALAETLDQLTERVTHLDDRLTGLDDGTLRARADLAAHSRRLTEVEDTVVAEAGRRGKQAATLADRMDQLTEALDRTLDRMGDLETRVATILREHDDRTQTGLRTAVAAQQASDALRRVVLRTHERTNQDHPDGSLVLTDAGLLRLPADDGVMLPLLSSNGVWEPELSALIDSLVEPGGVFVDIGAYVGYHTLRVLSRLGTSGSVVAVEPAVDATILLRHNVEMNVSEAVADRLTLIPAAAWDTPGALAAEPAMTGGVTVRPMPAEPAGQVAATVPAVRLDREFEAVEGLRGMPLSVVKVDIAGRGHRALGGLVRLLRRDRPHVFCAFSAERTSEIGDDPITVLREFDTWGFDVVVLGDSEPLPPQAIVEANAGQYSTTLWLRPRGKPA